jgi:hypothetical protein
MERARWTDERLDRQMNDIDKRYDRVFDELRADRQAWRAEAGALRAEMQGMRTDMQSMRTDMQGMRTDMRTDIQGLRTDMQTGFLQLHGELHAVQRQTVMVLAVLGAALLGVFGAAQL